MTRELLPFQGIGAQFLASRRRALLADEMRVGKTVQALCASEMVKAREVLVLCPAIARSVWLAEYAAWSGRPGAKIVSVDQKIERAPLIVCNYDLLIQKPIYAQLARNFDVVIIDESHFCKDLTASRTQASFGIAAGATYSWALSGTPEPNNRAEWYALLYSYGVVQCDYSSFVSRYCETVNTGFARKVVGTRNDAEFAGLLQGFMLRRLLRDVAPSMPGARWVRVPIEPGEVPDVFQGRAELIAAADREAVALQQRLDVARDLLDALEPSAATAFRRINGLRKVDGVVATLAAELDAGLPKVIVFGWHQDVLDLVQRRLAKYDARAYHGGVRKADRDSAVDAFKRGACRVLACNILAAGTAVDLSCADELVFIEEDWVPANNLQAAMRCISQFKTRPSMVRTFTLDQGLDARITTACHAKLARQQPIFQFSIAV